MSEYDEVFEQEKQYLEKVMTFLHEQIETSGSNVQSQKKALVDLRREMWNEGAKSSDEFDRAVELTQYFTMEAIESSQYTHKLEKLKTYEKMIDKPYFGRFDFTEEREGREAIYIGYHNLMNDDTYQVLVYDWRAPISSIFYRNEIGGASYKAPCGNIAGEVHLKRQYEIKKSELEYFFDCNLTITDELLQQALGNNTSTQMKNIVETIQKEQDMIIRDKDNDLLIVQGVAGSGKTSIAMHRVAFLLYDRMDEGLSHNNIVIISPNQLFGEYISNVLPELGEQNVCHLTAEEIFDEYFGGRVRMRDRISQLEYMIHSKHRDAVRQNVAFKGSETFITIMDRLVECYEGELLQFNDIYYDNELVETKESLKKQFLNNKINMSIMRRLKRMEQRLMDQIKVLEVEKRKTLMEEIEKDGSYEFEEEQRCNMLLGQYKDAAGQNVRSFTRIHVLNMYRKVFADKKLFAKLSKGLELPEGWEAICQQTMRSLSGERIPYEDGMALLYLHMQLEGGTHYAHIKQVVIDEAQDYYPVHYKIFGQMFKGAHFTVLGDVCQTIEKAEDHSFYDVVAQLINPKNSLKLDLTKSYRSSYEINQLTQKLRGDISPLIAFERHDECPLIKQVVDEKAMDNEVVGKVHEYLESGLESVVILCKTSKEVEKIYERLNNRVKLKKVTREDTQLEKGIVIMPIYMAKGLEYDGVIVYDVDQGNYHNGFDKQLLYIACTRALHRLSLYYIGEESDLLKGCH